jgi:hypothetical protein
MRAVSRVGQNIAIGILRKSGSRSVPDEMIFHAGKAAVRRFHRRISQMLR